MALRTVLVRGARALPLATNARGGSARALAMLPATVHPSPSSRATRSASVGGMAAFAAVAAGTTVAYAAAPAVELGPSKEEIAACRAAIEALLDDDDEMGPTIVRLAWHASGTYDKKSDSGGSDGATMRFNPEAGHGANAGLHVARDALEPVKKMFPAISYADLWTVSSPSLPR